MIKLKNILGEDTMANKISKLTPNFNNLKSSRSETDPYDIGVDGFDGVIDTAKDTTSDTESNPEEIKMQLDGLREALDSYLIDNLKFHSQENMYKKSFGNDFIAFQLDVNYSLGYLIVTIVAGAFLKKMGLYPVIKEILPPIKSTEQIRVGTTLINSAISACHDMFSSPAYKEEIRRIQSK